MANSSKLFSLLSVFSIAFLTLHAAMAADPLFHFCSNSGNFTTNSNYQNNLNKLLGDLYLKTPINGGFGSASAGQYSDQTYGLSLCRGDASAADCKACVADAGSALRDRCPYNKGAIIWYDNCLLKYSEEDFLGKIDNNNKFYMWNVQEVSNPEVFNGKTKELLTELAEKTYTSKNLYATGEVELEGSNRLYGLVQCTRDLSEEECKKCLDGVIGELPNCCDAKEGGRVVGGSCNFRYEIYPFVNAS